MRFNNKLNSELDPKPMAPLTMEMISLITWPVSWLNFRFDPLLFNEQIDDECTDWCMDHRIMID